MASPAQQQVLQWVIPPGQAEVQYSPQALGQHVQNFAVTRDGTLRTVPLITPYEIAPGPNERIESSYWPQPAGCPEVLTEGYDGQTYACSTPLGTVFHARLFDKCADMLFVSAGTKLYMHKPWCRSALLSLGVYAEPNFLPVLRDLTAPTDDQQTLTGPVIFPHQFVTFNDFVIFNNGFDQAHIITPEGTAFKLGFRDIPSAPIAEGPTGVDIVGRDSFYPNSHGYSWEGNIGTAGDMLSGDGGGVLAGHFIYHIQYEDQFGNRSATSSRSNAVHIQPHSANPIRGGTEAVEGIIAALEETLGLEIKDTQRQFLLRCSLPDHTPIGSASDSNWTSNGVSVKDSARASDVIAVNIYRTPDIDNVGPTPRLVTRMSAAGDFDFPDNVPDAELGDDMVPTVAIPIFKVMCVHQGRLIIGNISGAPGMVMRSEQGYPGTFSAIDFTFPDSGGSEITALFSHNNQLLAFTETTVYAMDDFAAPTPITHGVGCVAPQSIQVMRDGSLIWLGRDGFYALQGGAINMISTAIDRTMKVHVNRNRLRLAASVIDPDSGEYRCAVCKTGSTAQSLVLCFDGNYWREINYNMHISSFAVTQDARNLCLVAATDATFEGYFKGQTAGLPLWSRYRGDVVDELHRRGPSVYVVNRETAASSLTCDFSHKAVYRSGWLRADQNSLTPVNVRTMYIALVDTENASFRLKFYKNGSTKVVNELTVKSIGIDDGTEVVEDVGDFAVVGSSRTQRPRLFWRKIPVNMSTVNTWCFEIETTIDGAGGSVEIASFAFDVSVATAGNPRARIPGREDV